MSIKNKKQPRSIEKDVLFRSMFLSLTLIMVFGIVFFIFSYRDRTESVKDILRQHNFSLNMNFNEYIHGVSTVINMLSVDPLVKFQRTNSELEQDSLLKLYRYIVKSNDKISYAYSGYEDGYIAVNNWEAPDAYEVRLRPWYLNAIRKNPNAAMLEPYIEAISGALHVACTKTFFGEDGRLLGVVGVDSNVELFKKNLTDLGTGYRSLNSFIIKNNGEIIVHPTKNIGGGAKCNIWTNLAPAIVESRSGFFTYEMGGVEKLAYQSTLEATGWRVITFVNKSEIIMPVIKDIALYATILFLVALIWGYFFSVNLTLNIIRPLLQLKLQMQLIVSGKKYDEENWIYPDNEIGEIAQSAARLAQEELHAKNVELESSKKILEEFSYTDQLTGLFNRRKLDSSLQDALERNNTNKYGVSLLLIDVDFFKKVNDDFGHQVGDEVLRRLAKLFRESIRGADLVGRWGGEEFLVICVNTSVAGAELLAEKICSTIREYDFSLGRQVTVSIGVVESQANQGAVSLLQQVDRNLYQAKEGGRDRVVV